MSSSSTEQQIPDAEPAASTSINSNPTEETTPSSTQYSFTPDANKTSKKSEEEEDKNKDDSAFLCNICLDSAKDAVVSFCGHLFCWFCLNTWLETRPLRKLCPVCKAAISKEKVIPLYGRNSENQQDPRSKIPPRPSGQRTEPDPSQGGFQGFQSFGGDGFHLSFGIGAFPFGFFASSFNFNDLSRNVGAQQGGAQYEEDLFLSKVFLWVALIFFSWLILA